MTALVLTIPARRDLVRLFQHPPVENLEARNGVTIRLAVPPMHGVEIDVGAMTRAESAVLAGQIAAARNAEVLVQVPDYAAPYAGAGLTVASVSGLSLTLSGWSGVWLDGKRLSILRGGRRYLVPTVGPISGQTVTMATSPRVAFQAGDVVTYNAPLIQGLMLNAGQVVEEIDRRGVCPGVKLIVREPV